MKRLFSAMLITVLFVVSSGFCGAPGTLKWSIKPEPSNIPSPAIAKDGTVYVTGGSRLKALNPETGGINWSYDSGMPINAAPVIMPDQNICVAGANGTLYIVDSSGLLKFSRNFGDGFINQQVAVSGEGNIFLAYGNILYCLSPELETIWTYVASDTLDSSPVIGQDGSIYLSCQTARTFYGINIDGTLKFRQTYPWAAGNSYDNGAFLGIPSIGASGQVYIGDSAGYLREVDPLTGSLVREWAGTDRSSMTCQPAVHNNGYNIIGCKNVGIYGFHPTTGSYMLLSYLGGATYSTPAIGSDGTVYLGVSYQATHQTYYFYALTPVFGGSDWSNWYFATRWSYFVGHPMTASPALGSDGTAYIGTTDGYVYAIYTENTGYQNNSPFPKFQHDNSNTGNSMYNSFMKSQPNIYDFGNVNLGTDISKTFLITNISTNSYTLGQIKLFDSNQSETAFLISDDCSGQSIAPGQSRQFTVCFRPVLNGRRSASVKIPFGNKALYVGVFGTGGCNGEASLIPVVYNGSNGQKLEGASVIVNAETLETDAEGKCIFTALDPGLYTVEVTKDGYSPNTKEVDLLASSNTYSNIILYPSNFEAPTITDISSKYEGRVFYINGVNFNVKYTVNIDWAGHTPSKVKFITPKGVFEENTTENTVSKTFNMGTDFGIGGTLTVQAVTDTGALSEEKEADFTVIKWIPLFPLTALDKGGYFSYSSSLGLNWNLFNEGVDGSAIPSDIPLFGGNPILLKLIPTVEAKVSWDGSASIELQYEGLQAEKKIDSGKLAGFSFSLYPLVNISGQYFPSAGDWNWDGYVGMHGEAEFKKSWPFVVMVGPVPVPMYAKASFSLEADALLGIVELEPLSINGQLSIEPYVRGSLGAGVDEILAVEGWIGGGMEIGLQFPQEPTLEELSLYLNGGFTVYALLFSWENEVLRWDWSLIDNKTKMGDIPFLGPQTPKIFTREYLNLPDYGRFTGGSTVSMKSLKDETGKSATIRYTTLQEEVFPYSEPSLSSAGSYLYAAWLYDDPVRDALNRTKLVFSSYDGSAWSAPQTVADDGTADFHPSLIAFADGTAAVVWENEKTVLADGASFEDMKQNLEICASLYNPVDHTWSTPYTFTDNSDLDRSPKVRGTNINTLMVMWISNSCGHVTGTKDMPNKIYSSTWNGTVWTSPILAVQEILYYDSDKPNPFQKPIINYDFIYTGDANAYFCIDMDEDTSTLDDREIFGLRGGSTFWLDPSWPWNRTTNSVPDENPRMVANIEGVYWIRGNTLFFTNYWMDGVTPPTPIYVFEGEYSSNVSSFSIARSPAGRLAVIWSEPSEYSSDLWAVFYDPSLRVCGKPQRLTFDAQTERSPVFAFYGEDTLVGIYDKIDVNISYEKRQTLTGKTVTIPVRQMGSASLASFMHTISTDIALKPGSLAVTPVNPLCGSVADIIVTVMNMGNTAQKDITVSFYNGDPHNGGVLIEEVVIPILVPAEEKTVSVEWTVPEISQPVTLYAVADPAGLITGDTDANNTLTLTCVFPDIDTEVLVRKNVTDTLLVLTGTVRNVGARDTGEFVVEIRKDSKNGQLLYQKMIDNLEPNEIKQVTYLWDATGIVMDNVWLYLVADAEDAVAEFDDSNNTYLLKINPSLLKGDINGDDSIDISDVILCLRMAVGLPIIIDGQTYESPYTDRFKGVADINSSLDVDISDVILILRKVVGLD